MRNQFNMTGFEDSGRGCKLRNVGAFRIWKDQRPCSPGRKVAFEEIWLPP
jgi:hypothetical protein